MKCLSLILAILTVSQFAHGQAADIHEQHAAVPSLCRPCLFYGGDLDPSDPGSWGFYNEFTDHVSAETVGVIHLPEERTVSIEGILFQTLFGGADKLDPKSVTWEIRADVTNGYGGTVVASGGGQAAMEPTGRSLNGFGTEYTVAVRVEPPVQLSGGLRYPGAFYWFNLTPVCDNPHDSACKSEQYFVSNSTQLTNSFRSAAQPVLEIYTNSIHYGYDWLQCGGAPNGASCGALSFGLMGTVVQ